MVIVLKNADFSDNNIGKVETEVVLNAYTQAAIIASGNTSLTKIQKSALNSLFLAMGVDGSNNVMSKLRKLYLPMIASDVSNALVNYATNEFTKDATPNPENWQLRNLGITQKTTSQSFTLELSGQDVLNSNNFTQMWLRTENMVSGANDGGRTFVVRGKTSLSKYLGLIEESSSNNTQIRSSNYGYNGFNTGITKNREQRRVTGISFRASDDISKLLYGSYTHITDGSITASTDMTGETAQYLYVLGLGNVDAPHPYGFMLLGESITDAQFKDIAEKVEALYAAMKA